MFISVLLACVYVYGGEEMDRVRSNLSGLDWEEGWWKGFVYSPEKCVYTRRGGSCCRVGFSLWRSWLPVGAEHCGQSHCSAIWAHTPGPGQVTRQRSQVSFSWVTWLSLGYPLTRPLAVSSLLITQAFSPEWCLFFLFDGHWVSSPRVSRSWGTNGKIVTGSLWTGFLLWQSRFRA